MLRREFESLHLAGFPDWARSSSAARRGKPQRRQATFRLTGRLGVTRNIEVEYAALVSTLADLRGRIEQAGKFLHGYTVVATTSFHLLAGQLTQGWQV